MYSYPKGFQSALLRLDAGDLVYSLLFCQILGTKNIFFGANDNIDKYVNPNSMCGVPGKCSAKTISFLSPLIFRQKDRFEKIEEFSGQEYTYDYGEFSIYFPPIVGTNLTEWHSRKFNINWLDLNFPWLSADKDDRFKNKVLINKTSRYTKKCNPYYSNIMSMYRSDCVFIGIKNDYDNFCEEYNTKIDYFQSDDSLEMANAINSSLMFVGNSSFCAALAVGLGKTSHIEINKINNYFFLNSYCNFFA